MLTRVNFPATADRRYGGLIRAEKLIRPQSLFTNGAFFCTKSVSSLVRRLPGFVAERRRLQEMFHTCVLSTPYIYILKRHLKFHLFQSAFTA